MQRANQRPYLAILLKKSPDRADCSHYNDAILLKRKCRGVGVMVRDGLVNIVVRLKERGFDPRRVGPDAWEALCPQHGGVDHALAITRDGLGHPQLDCRGSRGCQYARILRALELEGKVLAETDEWWLNWANHAPIQPARFPSASPNASAQAAMGLAQPANGPSGAPHDSSATAGAIPIGSGLVSSS